MFLSNCLAYGLFYAKMSTNGSRVWITGLIIFSYRISIACCLNLLHTKNTEKDANFLHALDVQKAKKRLQLQGEAPLTPHRGLCPLDSRTAVIGSRYRARHGPHTFWHLPAPMLNTDNITTSAASSSSSSKRGVPARFRSWLLLHCWEAIMNSQCLQSSSLNCSDWNHANTYRF